MENDGAALKSSILKEMVSDRSPTTFTFCVQNDVLLKDKLAESFLCQLSEPFTIS